ncbi:MAG: hypothetical protein ACRDT8_15905, partial [Micromonosporaceae bacterium]
MSEAIDLRFRTVLSRLEAAGRIASLEREVDLEYEAAAILKRHDGDRALVFPRVKGHQVPVVGNLLASTAN